MLRSAAAPNPERHTDSCPIRQLDTHPQSPRRSQASIAPTPSVKNHATSHSEFASLRIRQMKTIDLIRGLCSKTFRCDEYSDLVPAASQIHRASGD